MTLFLFGLALTAYFAVHSLLAANGVKAFLQKYLIPERYYRLIYNGLAIILFVLVAGFYLNMQHRFLLEISWRWIPAAALTGSGISWIIMALWGYDLDEFSGFSVFRKNPDPQPIALKTNGLNAKVRHPLYTGVLLVTIGLFINKPTDVTLVAVIVTVSYLLIGISLEERKLEQQFGEAWRSYRATTPMLLPFLRKK